MLYMLLLLFIVVLWYFVMCLMCVAKKADEDADRCFKKLMEDKPNANSHDY
jgi:hypothetical protein